MEYRDFCNGTKTSLLGFGCMRFPTVDGKIDEVTAEKMIDTAIAAGVNYIDTAYPYHNGDSEPFVGKVLKKYPRDSFYLATKLPMWKLEKTEDVRAIFEEQLKRLDVEYVDFYLLHALSKDRFETMKNLHVIEECLKLKEEGKIKNLGFSFHDTYEVFDEIIHYYPWDFCQIQFNYMDTDIQAGMDGYLLAKEMNIPMVIMEPIKGGNLSNIPADIDAHFKNYDPEASTSSWALRFVGSKDNVKCILSGMSTPEQVEDNLKTFKDFKPLSAKEEAIVATVKKELKERTNNGCTDCQYCMPCPVGVQIPQTFAYWNELARYNNYNRVHNAYMNLEKLADVCVKCGKCEAACPQHLDIRNDLVKAHEALK